MFAANAERVQVVMHRLSVMLRTGDKNVQKFEHNLLALARGIDFSVANGEIPSKAPELSLLVKQICERKGDNSILPLIMVLMISIENACKLGWFSAIDTKEIIDLYKEISTSFCLPENIDDEMSMSNPHVQAIMDRFYPQLSLGKILACLEVKPGYGAYLVDFHIIKNVGFPPQEKIRLLVAQIDNTETSSCLISPQQVSFMLNGNGVIGRVNCATATLDTGPQIPTIVTRMLKYGPNLLQVVGHFSGNYVIAIAFMGVKCSSTSELKDYVQHGVTSVNSDADSDVIVGSSRVSINCPISRKRIKTPVKGHSCKHVQCFDFENYVDINSRRPSWRCPHCNQHVSFMDIRLDQNMVKILNEVGDSVKDVIISPDGSWKLASEIDGHVDGSGDTDINHGPESEQRSMRISSNASFEILDLTMEGDVMDLDPISDIEDRKPSHIDLVNSMGSHVNMQTELNTSNQAGQSMGSQMDDIWSGLDLPGYSIEPFVDRFDNHNMTNTLHPSDFAPATNQEPNFHNNSSSLGTIDGSVQHSQLVNSSMNNQHVRVSSTVTRTPTAAVQALPASNGMPVSRFTSGAISTGMVSGGTSSQGSGLNRLHLPEIPSYQSQQISTGQSLDGRQVHNSAVLNSSSMSTNHFSNSQMMSSGNLQQRLHQLQQLHRQSAGMMQTHHLPRMHYQPASADMRASGTVPFQNILPSRPAFQPLRQPHPSAYQNQTLRPGISYPSNVSAPPGMSVQQPRPVQQVSRSEHLVNLSSADSNLRPAGRMRGSLSGRAYEDARNQFLSPSQSTRAPRPPPDLTSPPPGVPPELHEMITNLSVPGSSAPNS